MNKPLMFFLFIVIVIIGVLITLYILYEKPKQEEVKTVTEQVILNIYTFDKYNNTQISTDFKVLKNNEEIYNGTTLEGGGSTLNVTTNNSYTIKTFNKNNQDYYTSYFDLSLFGSNFNPQRINLYLEKPGSLTYTLSKDYQNYDTFLTLVANERDIKSTSVCITWSVNLISVTARGYNFSLDSISVYPFYKNYNKCYYMGDLIFNQSKMIIISPIAYIQKTPQDYIKIIIIDSDCYKNECKIEDNDIELGMKNIEFQTNLFVV